MTHKRTWQKREQEIGEMFGSKRNIMSGKLNSRDDGSPRPGDVVHTELIEVKLRSKNISITRAMDTKKEADKAGLSWVHIESKKGNKKVYAVCLPAEVCRGVADYLNTLWCALRAVKDADGMELERMSIVPEYRCKRCNMVFQSQGHNLQCTYCPDAQRGVAL